jgi:site-specific recombinase XerC
VIARLYRDVMRDKSYQLTPIGQQVAAFMRARRQALPSPHTQRSYESSLDKLARHFADLELADLNPPVGTERIEEYLDDRWGDAAPGTYNLNLTITSEFFKWAQSRGLVYGNPCTPVTRAKKRQPHRTVFNAADRRKIVAANTDPRDRVALRLLLDYGLRKGTLQKVQFKHFDHEHRRLTVFMKGAKIRQLPIPDTTFWHELTLLMLSRDTEPTHYLMASSRMRFAGDGKRVRRLYPEKPMSDSAGMHRWWYGCLERAGIVPVGTSAGERMHKARHTAGQRVLDQTGDLKLVQKLLAHDSIKTTGDIYVDYDIDQFAERLARAHEQEREHDE